MIMAIAQFLKDRVSLILLLIVMITKCGSSNKTIAQSLSSPGSLYKPDQSRSGQSRFNGVPDRIPRRLGILRLGVTAKPKISPLYLINGTVCRFINLQPICTTLSTTGLIRSGESGASSGNRGTSGGGAGGGGSGGGSSGGGSGGGGSSGGGSARPSTAGVSSSGGSSVQFANQPSRLALNDNESTPVQVDNVGSMESATVIRNPAINQPPIQPPLTVQPLMVARRPFSGFFPFRRPQYQLVTRSGDGQYAGQKIEKKNAKDSTKA